MQVVFNKSTDRFFISINKSEGHSFVMLGVYEGNKVKHLFSRVGKAYTVNKKEYSDNKCLQLLKLRCQTLFTTAKARLYDEDINDTRRLLSSPVPLDYQAYDITYEHYLEFIRILETIHSFENPFYYYKVVNETLDQFCFERTKISNIEVDSTLEKLKQNTQELNLGNTCRHTAIQLVEEVQKTPVSSMVSSYFFSDLLCTTILKYGKPSEEFPFYVLPISPALYPELCGKKKEIIKSLYKRMERLLLIDPHSPQTQQKFATLKNLYIQIVGSQKDSSLDEILISIQKWKQENQVILSSLRKSYFWDFFFKRRSATMSLIDKIEQGLQNKTKL